VVPVVLLSTVLLSLASVLNAFVFRRPLKELRGLAVLWGKLILWCSGVKVKREGGGSLDPEAPYVFAANHQSQYDIFVLSGYLGHDASWLAKKELFAVPLWGRAMRDAGYIPLDRSRGREAIKSLAEAAARIAAGTSVVIFPEGTRSRDGRLGEFKSGAMHLAIKAGVPVVPVAIGGTHRILPKGSLLPRPGHVTVRVGEAVDVGEYGPKGKQELAGRIRAEVESMLSDHSFPVEQKGKIE
jgi:1-acyl-sn-glycerol-3-phosphate acyltransferase